jgi:riboflavin synthase
MFTGITESIGHVKRVVRRKTNQLFIDTVLTVKTGDSVSIQGVCLTVIRIEKKGFWVETMPQTKATTTLDHIIINDPVNVERALAMGDRIGGHILLGHIDEIGKFIRKKTNEFYFQYNGANFQYLVSKGSIAINGVSLTLGNISKRAFSVNLIPYTLSTTTLGGLKIGDLVNIEYDYLAKLLHGSDHLRL